MYLLQTLQQPTSPTKGPLERYPPKLWFILAHPRQWGGTNSWSKDAGVGFLEGPLKNPWNI